MPFATLEIESIECSTHTPHMCTTLHDIAAIVHDFYGPDCLFVFRCSFIEYQFSLSTQFLSSC